MVKFPRLQVGGTHSSYRHANEGGNVPSSFAQDESCACLDNEDRLISCGSPLSRKRRRIINQNGDRKKKSSRSIHSLPIHDGGEIRIGEFIVI